MIKNSLIIPAYNEYENLLSMLSDIEKEFIDEIKKKELEVIIINDGSTDKTKDFLNKDIKDKRAKIKIIHLIKNQGKSFALEISFNYVEGDNIVIIDADQQYSIKDAKKLLNLLEKNNCDLINGRREDRKDDKLTKLTSKIYNFIIRKTLNVECKDFFSGLKVFKAKILKTINFRDLCRFIILLTHVQGFKIIEEPINHRQRTYGVSRYNLISRIKLSINDFITIFFLRLINKYKIYILNIYLRFSLAIYLIILALSLINDETFNYLNFVNDKILIFLILLNLIAIILSSILYLHERRHKAASSERLKNIDTIFINNV